MARRAWTLQVRYTHFALSFTPDFPRTHPSPQPAFTLPLTTLHPPRCAAWEEALRARGVATIYRDPYWFLPTRVGGGWQKLPEWKSTSVEAAAA